MKSCPNRWKAVSAFTLVELMVTMAILVILVGFMVTIVRTSMRTWETSESKVILYSKARKIFQTLKEDLNSLMIPPSPEGKGILFLGDHDPVSWKVRLRFVRSIEGEERNWMYQRSGRQLLPEGYQDGNKDFEESISGNLKPPGGMMEVAYFMGSKENSQKLYRAFCAPIGGSNSLFQDKNLQPSAFHQVLADHVLYFEIRYWSPWTKSWDLPLGENLPSNVLKSAPLLVWDSSRSRLDPKIYGDEFKKFPLNKKGAFVLPQRILLTLVLEDPLESPMSLSQNITEKTQKIPIFGIHRLKGEKDFPYLWIDGEWIRYEKIEGSYAVIGTSGARGARLTLPKSHSLGTSVKKGRTFRFVINLPQGWWNFREK